MIRKPNIFTAVVLVAMITAPMLAPPVFAEKLQNSTLQAWNRYLAWADASVQRQLADPKRFLIEDFVPADQQRAVRKQVLAGSVEVMRVSNVAPAGVAFSVPDGEIHHWWASILVPDIKLPELMRFLKDYDHHAGRFTDVERSRLLSHNGEAYRFLFRLKRTKAFFTVYYNAEQECIYTEHGPGRISSRSYATKIAEIENAGTNKEHERPPGDDQGFLWRLVSWWRFQETPQGVIVECESASLSRSIPAVVKLLPWAASYIRSTPKESLESVLLNIRIHVRE